MNYLSLLLAALGGTLASFVVGGLIFWLVPALGEEAHKYPTVFRPKEEMMKVMPVGMGASFVAVLIATVIFAIMHEGGPSAKEGAIFGALMGGFVVFGFVLHNYANLNIGIKLALGQAAAYFVQWTVVGTVIGLIYRAPTP